MSFRPTDRCFGELGHRAAGSSIGHSLGDWQLLEQRLARLETTDLRLQTMQRALEANTAENKQTAERAREYLATLVRQVSSVESKQERIESQLREMSAKLDRLVGDGR